MAFEVNATNCPPAWAELLFHGTNVVTGVTVTTNAPSLPEGFPSEFLEEYVPNAIVVTTNTTYMGASAAFFRLGTMRDSNTNGWTDAYEILVTQTDPLDSDTDGLPDAFELDYSGLSPYAPSDPWSDPDGDGLDTDEEYSHGRGPFDADSDGDGVSDGEEVSQSSNPADELDKDPYPAEEIVSLPITVYGDYASWKMTIQGLDEDTRKFTLTTHFAGDRTTKTIQFRRGNSYRVTMFWGGSYPRLNPRWYCWEALMDGYPSAFFNIIEKGNLK